MDKIFLTWEEVYKQSLQLSEKIKNDINKSGEHFDFMVVVPRGGYFPANVISRQLKFGATDLLHACVGSYDSGENNRNDLSVGELPAAEKIQGKNLLIIDEVCDTGETLEFITDYLKKNGANLIRSGVLHFKPNNSVNGYQPDWYVENTDQWIVYPWEQNEYA